MAKPKKSNGKFSTQKSAEKHQKIIDAAAKVFSAKGYAEGTLDEVAKEADTHAGSLYYYFPSKEHLVENLLEIGTTIVSEPVIEAVSKLPPGTSEREKLEVALRLHSAIMLQENDIIRAYWKLIDQVPEPLRRFSMRKRREYGDFFQDLFDKAQAKKAIRNDLDSNALRMLILGSTISAVSWFNPNGKLTAEDIAEILIKLLFGDGRKKTKK